jgi:uncharacterized protein (DUF2062 family)
MTERYRELVLTIQGFWYKSYDSSPHLLARRISPRSYRAGLAVGRMSGFWAGFMFCLAIVFALVVASA